MTFNIASVRHPKEKTYGLATLVVGAALWLLVGLAVVLGEQPILGLIGLLAYGLVIWGVSTAIQALTRAYMFGHFVMVGPDQFPRIHAMVEEGARRLGLDEVPLAFVYNSNGVMNAFALRLIGRRRYVWLTSALIDADSEEQLRFVIGHELGHHAAGHLEQFPGIVRLPAMVVPFLGAAYSRARELTCDRIGAFLVRDLTVSRTALQMLACGSAKLNAQMNATAFAQQDMMVPPFAGFLLNIFSGYPRLSKRVEEVGRWLASQEGLQRAAAQPVASAA
jgi:Zn-dependent protease with chaperone function